MTLGAAAAPPVGYLEFCARNPNECTNQARSADQAAQPASAYVGGVMDPAGHVLAAAATGLDAAAQPASASVEAPILDPVSPALAVAGGVPLATNPLAELSPPTPLGSLRHYPFGRDHWAGHFATPYLESDVATVADAAVADDLTLAGAFRPMPRPPVLADLFAVSDVSTPPAAAPLRMTPALLTHLEAVNQQINGAIRPLSAKDPAHDSWRLAIADGTRAGDCKDYVLEKRRALILQGVPEQALSIAVVLTARGEGHAVLVVTTDKGEFVLDNLNPWVSPWRSVGYHWLLRQQPGEPLHWVSIVEPGRVGEA